MKNKYSLSLLGITAVLLLYSIWWLIASPFPVDMLGLIPLIFSSLMFYHGFQSPTLASNTSSGSGGASSSRKIWLLTVFGRQVDVMIEGLTFICDWLGVEIVGAVEVDMEQFSKNFKTKKRILCKKKEKNGELVNDGYVDLQIDMAFTPNASDGPSALWKFVNAGQRDGVLNIVDGLITPLAVEIGSTHSNNWMETQTLELNALLLNRIKGRLNGNASATDIDTTDDLRDLGVTITKFNASATPKDTVITHRDDLLVEEAQRVSQKLDTDTMNERIEKRIELLTKSRKDANGNMVPGLSYAEALKKARKQIFEEQALKQDKLTIIQNKGGVNLANANQPTK